MSQALERIRQAARQQEEGEVHRALPPYQHRSLPGGVLRAQARCRAGRGRADMADLRSRPRPRTSLICILGSNGEHIGHCHRAGRTYRRQMANSARSAVAALEDKIVQSGGRGGPERRSMRRTSSGSAMGSGRSAVSTMRWMRWSFGIDSTTGELHSRRGRPILFGSCFILPPGS